MKKFKRAAALFLALALLGGTGCGKTAPINTPDSGSEIVYAEDQTLRMMYQYESFDLASASNMGLPAEGIYAPSCNEPLLMLDQYGNLVYGLADNYTANEDQTVFTFHIREGLYWVDCKGEPQAELTAQDFVTTAKINCKPGSSSSAAFYYNGIVKGASAYMNAQTDDFSTVGFKAVDKYTLEITLERPTPYFIDNCVNFVPYPTDFYTQQGDGYGNSVEQVLSIGAFYISEWEPESKRVYTKNPHYWDADQVHIQKVELIFNEQANVLAPEMLKRGEIDLTGIGTDILTDWMENEATSGTAIPMTDTTYTCYYSFCYAPQFGEDYEQENYLKAIDNENFRQSLYWGLDRLKARLVTVPQNTELYLSNTITPVGWCGVNGKDYTEYEALSSIMSRANASFDSAKALEYKEKAVAELTAAGVTFPVKLLMPYSPSSESWANEAQVVKQQLESLLGSDYIEIVVEAGPLLEFTQAVRNQGKYGLMRLFDGANVRDPANWTIAFMGGNTRTFLDRAATPNLKELSQTYQTMLNKAWGIGTKSDERYTAFAEAEAFLLEHALVIPFSKESNGDYFIAGRINPLEMVKGTSYSYKYMHVLESNLTNEQYEALYADWLAEKEASKVNAIA